MRICGYCGHYMDGDGYPMIGAPSIRLHRHCAAELARVFKSPSVEGERNAGPKPERKAKGTDGVR